MLPMGGSERVTLAAIEALMSLGWEVDLYLVAGFNPSELYDSFGGWRDLRCRVRVNRVPAFRQSAYGRRRGGVYLDLARSVLDKRVGECDIFIDMVPFLSSHFAPYLRFPDVTYWNLLPSDLAWMRNKRSVMERAYLAPLRTLARTFVRRWNKVKVHIANSEYTRAAINARLSPELHPIVIYPPVDLQSWFVGPDPSNGRNGVVSLGRFETWKRHDLQLEIARRLQVPFRLIGRAMRYDELAQLSKLKVGARNTQIEFHVNVPQSEAKRILGSSKVYIHTADAEPFGISIVEAVAAGCVPIVRDEGGVSEIVPYPELRFNTLSEAEEKMRRALNGEFDYLMNELTAHVQRFGKERFQREFADHISNITES